MIAKVEAEITGNFVIEKDMEVKLHPFTIDVRYTSEFDKFFISVSRKVNDYARFIPNVKADNGNLLELNFPMQDYLKEHITILQHIESFGAIDKEIEEIYWQNISIEWIPETVEEEQELLISKVVRRQSFSSKTRILSKDWLFNTVLHRNQLSQLALPLSFYREGANLYHNFQYQSSFLQFYLMLEGFFGNAEHKNDKMKKEFAKSEILDLAIKETITWLENERSNHYQWLVQTCQKYNKAVNKEGIIHLLVELRGNLSHFSILKPSKQKNPFKESDYHSLAFIAMMICRFSSIKLRLEPFRNRVTS